MENGLSLRACFHASSASIPGSIFMLFLLLAKNFQLLIDLPHHLIKSPQVTACEQDIGP